jgi:hypothetical protein
MSPSQEILNSIEDRLRQLAQEIAALEAARAELQSETVKPSRRRTAKPGQSRGSRTTREVAAAPEISEEEWVERRAAELAAQSRQAAA